MRGSGEDKARAFALTVAGEGNGKDAKDVPTVDFVKESVQSPDALIPVSTSGCLAERPREKRSQDPPPNDWVGEVAP